MGFSWQVYKFNSPTDGISECEHLQEIKDGQFVTQGNHKTFIESLSKAVGKEKPKVIVTSVNNLKANYISSANSSMLYWYTYPSIL